MKKVLVLATLGFLGQATNSFALATSCPVDDNWANDVVGETYTYQQYRDNPVQNISGDSIALNFDGLGVYSDGEVKAGDQLRFTLTNGATFTANPLFPDPNYPSITPTWVLEEDLGGAGTGDLTVATLVEADPSGTNTMTFNLNPASFDGSPFSAPPEPCLSWDNYFAGEGVILSGANIAGQSTYYSFAAEPWAAQDVILQIDYIRDGSRLFGGERVLFSVSDFLTADTDGDGIANGDDPFPTSVTSATDNGVSLTITPPSATSSCSITALSGASVASSYPNVAVQGVGVSAGFTLSGCDTGSPESVSVSIDLGVTPAPDSVVYKIVSGGAWEAISGATIVGSVVSYTIVDNGPLDQNPAAGVIEDPVTAAKPFTLAPARPVPALPLFGLVILGSLLGMFGWRKIRQ